MVVFRVLSDTASVALAWKPLYRTSTSWKYNGTDKILHYYEPVGFVDMFQAGTNLHKVKMSHPKMPIPKCLSVCSAYHAPRMYSLFNWS